MNPNQYNQSNPGPQSQPVNNGNYSVNNPNFAQPVKSEQSVPMSQIQPTDIQTNTSPTINQSQPPTIKDSGKANISTQKTSSQPNNPNSTQNTLQIAEIKEGILIMKDGSYKAVVVCKSINFDLMSYREREGIEYGYQGFLNSLYFPIQILIRSNKVDIGPYLEKLLKIRSEQDNMLLNVLMDDYLNYIEMLAQEANIMDKSFYVVIPYYSTTESFNDIKKQSQNILTSLFSSNKNPSQPVKINNQTYLKAKEEIQNRVDVVISGLSQVGVQAKQLNTAQLSQLFYNFYNPDISAREALVNFDQISTVYTRKANDQPAGDL
ncbi:MAG: hypothetical protein Q3996_00355 [Candidatus Saccharibacteria bacterium]|nr:hypothetical protein [Candidatus Saccharibacteria bacterium]